MIVLNGTYKSLFCWEEHISLSQAPQQSPTTDSTYTWTSNIPDQEPDNITIYLEAHYISRPVHLGPYPMYETPPGQVLGFFTVGTGLLAWRPLAHMN